MRPIEIRIKKGTNVPVRITVVYEGAGNTAVKWISKNWRDWLAEHGWLTVPRIWE